MPFVTVHMWEGRSVADKRALTAAITAAMVEHAHARQEALHVVIQEYPLENWARGGVLGVDMTDGANGTDSGGGTDGAGRTDSRGRTNDVDRIDGGDRTDG